MQQAATNTKPALRQPARKRIVMLDDHPGVREAIESVIRTFLPDAEIDQFDNGDEAFEELLRRPPDLLMTDIVHPGMQCIDMCRFFAKIKVRFPVLIVSAQDSPEIRTRIRRFVGRRLRVDFVSKPFSPDVLVRLFKKHLRL